MRTSVAEFPDDTIQFEKWRTLDAAARRKLKMSPELRDKFYQHDYYLRQRAKRAKRHKERWSENSEYRDREIKRAQDRRAFRRAETAPGRFKEMVEAVEGDALKPHRAPVVVEIKGEEALVFTTAALAVHCGRRVSTVRTWIEDNVLPGVSAVIGGRGKFTTKFMDAVRSACERILYIDGRGNHTQLRFLIVEELGKLGESYVPVKKALPSDHERPSLIEAGDRVWPEKPRA